MSSSRVLAAGRKAGLPARVSMCVNCACAGMNIGFEAAADLPLDSLRRQLEVNLVGQICVTQVPFSPVL